MAEALYALAEGLHWSPTTAPRGQFVVMQDRIEASGAFLVHHFLALFLKAGHRVCFLNLANPIEHYAAVGRKLGVNLTTCIDKRTLRVIDGFRSDVQSLSDLLAQLREQLDEATAAGAPFSIVIDDLNTLQWQFDRQTLVRFLRSCRALSGATGEANVVLLHHADAEAGSIRTATSVDGLTALQSPQLMDMATVALRVAPLPSGYCKDVHGTLTVQQMCMGLNGVFDASVSSFKVMENTIKRFAAGGDALRLL
ncbi:hypothetical protein ATCC90586_010459 [Pythium insidiosum]|nr:hypothetical protein ATCC90586_010459 [Pythium insidiosum]